MSQKYFSKLHMREHSNVIRIWSNKKSSHHSEAQECPIFPVEGLNRIVLVCMCRIRQRLLSQAWERLTKNTGVQHNYEEEVRMILSRKLPEELMRTELEIEVLYKWILQTKDLDPTGISSTIYSCKRKSAVFNALQQIRLEYYEPGEIVLFQGDFPRPEDGHFTIFKGNCDIVQFPEDSVPLLKVLYYAKKKKWDEAKKILQHAQILSKIHKLSGFGELATLTGVKRAASIRSSRKKNMITQILVLPKSALLECLSNKRGDSVEGAAPTEAIDFMRQSGLANRISPKDLVRAAGSMIKRNLTQGEILYFKGEKAKVLFLVVSGDLLLDTGDIWSSTNIDGTVTTSTTPHPCLNANATNCFPLSQGSILGDEGATGLENTFEATAMVVSEAAVVFEVVGFGLQFLREKFRCVKFCALSYMERSKWQSVVPYAEEMNPYTYFNSLRKCMAIMRPFRGTEDNIFPEEKAAASAVEELKKNVYLNTMTPDEKVAYNAAKIHLNNANRPSSGAKKVSPTNAGLSAKEAVVGGTGSGASGGIAASGSGAAGGSGALSATDKAKKKKKNVRMSYLLNALEKSIEQANNPEADPFAGAPRVLNKIALNRALEINRVVKKQLSLFNSASSRDNILFDQITKLPPEIKQLDSAVDEEKFRKNIKDHRDREAAKAKQIQMEEAAKKAAEEAAAAAQRVKFFTSIFEDDKAKTTFSKSTANLSVANPSDKEGAAAGEDHGNDANTHISTVTPVSTSVNTSSEQLVKEGSQVSLTGGGDVGRRRGGIAEEPGHKMEQYFNWIDRLTQQNLNHLIQQQTQSDIDKLTQLEKHGLVKQSLHELGVIFQQFDYCPAESPKHMTSEQRKEHKKANEGIGMAFFPLHFFGGRPTGGGNSASEAALMAARFAGYDMDDEDDDHKNSYSYQTADALIPPGTEEGAAANERPVTAVPPLDLPGSRPTTGAAAKEMEEWRGIVGKKKVTKSDKMAKGDKKIAQFKTYNVSSWREELIRKKAAALENIHKFHRCTTYPNRRILESMYVVPLPYQQHIVIANAQSTAPVHHQQQQPLAFMMENGSVASQTTTTGDMEPSIKSVNEESSHGNDESTFYNAEEQAEMLKQRLRQKAAEMIKCYDQPDLFIEQVKAKEFPKRGKYLANHEWNTRSMRMTANARITDEVSYDPEKSPSKRVTRPGTERKDSEGSIHLHMESLGIHRSGSGSPHSSGGLRSPSGLFRSPVSSPVSNALSGFNTVPLSPSSTSASVPPSRSRPVVEELDMASIHSSATETALLKNLTSWKEGSEGAAAGVVPPETVGGIDGVVVDSIIPSAEDTGREFQTLDTVLLDNLGFAPPGPNAADGIAAMGFTEDAAISTILNASSSGAVITVAAVAGLEVPGPSARGMTPMTIADNLTSPLGLDTPKTSGMPTMREDGGRESKKMTEIDLKMAAMKQNLINGRPDSVALEMYNKYVSTPIAPRYTEGKKFANDNSKFKLPVKLGGEVKEIESDRESLLAMEERKKFELALFNSVYGKDGDNKNVFNKDQRGLLVSYINKTLTSHKNASLHTSETSTEKGSRPTSPNLDQATNNRLIILKQLVPDFDPDNEIEAPVKPKDEYEQEMADLEEWQRYTIECVIKEKNSARKTLPVLTSKSLNLGKKFNANRARRWGSGSMVRIPAVAEEEPIEGPSSYLDVYKTNFKLRSSVKDRQKMASSLKAKKTVL